MEERTERHSRAARRAGLVLFQSAALALLFTTAMPAHAGDERAVKTRVAPVYPEIAKRMRIEGEVRLQATIDAGGNVTDVKEVAGNHVLAIAAEDAVRKWKFESGSGDSTIIIAVNFGQ
jgi:TonB family protein